MNFELTLELIDNIFKNYYKNFKVNEFKSFLQIEIIFIKLVVNF